MFTRTKFAKSQTAFFRWWADTFFKERYGHRALVLETVAGVPGMVGGMLTHLRSLRRLEKESGDRIHELLAEAENERQHLMFMMEVVQPSRLERVIIVLAQFLFWHYYLVMYLLSSKTAHLMTAYFEEEAVKSYTTYLELIGKGRISASKAPLAAIEYYNLREDATIYDMILCIREDERRHSEANHRMSKEA